MRVAIVAPGGYQGPMSEERIKELELLLVTANASVATLTRANTILASDLSDAEVRNKKLRRKSRKTESAFKQELALAQSRRG